MIVNAAATAHITPPGIAIAVYISGQRRGVSTRRLKRSLKRRQVIERIIGHLKNDDLPGRNYLNDQLGD